MPRNMDMSNFGEKLILFEMGGNIDMKVYLLEHAYDYGENLEHTETKTLGIYESRQMAEKAVSKYKLLPGFNEYDDECFYISEYELNAGSWLEGFIQVD